MDTHEYSSLVKIKEKCTVCGGTGYKEVRSSDEDKAQLSLLDCICIQQIQKELKLIDANIPKKYRNWTFNQLTPKFLSSNKKSFTIVKKYIEDISTNIHDGVGLWFVSLPGVAKSSIICTILKEAIDRNYTAYYTTAAHLISIKSLSMRNDPQAMQTLQHILNDVHILAVEEVEKRSLSEKSTYGNTLFYETISDIYDANVSLLVSSNRFRNECEKELPRFIQDRFKNLKTIVLSGDSGRTDHRG